MLAFLQPISEVDLVFVIVFPLFSGAMTIKKKKKKDKPVVSETAKSSLICCKRISLSPSSDLCETPNLECFSFNGAAALMSVCAFQL